VINETGSGYKGLKNGEFCKWLLLEKEEKYLPAIGLYRIPGTPPKEGKHIIHGG